MSDQKPADPSSAPDPAAYNAGAPPPYSAPMGGPPGGQAPYPPAPAPGFNPAVYPPAPGAPGAAYPAPGAAYAAPGGPGAPPHPQQMTAVPPGTQTITVTTQQRPDPATMVALIDQCPNCKVGNLQEQYTPAGICCAIFLFPFGIICCLMSRHKVCPVCGTAFFGR